MNRRNFLRNLFIGLVVAPKVIKENPSRFVVYTNPSTRMDDTMLMNFKGRSYMETGYVYCPYIPITVHDSYSQQT